MAAHNVHNIIFSGSALVYGERETAANKLLVESMPTGLDILNPYSRSKHMAELILSDCTNKVKYPIPDHLNVIGLVEKFNKHRSAFTLNYICQCNSSLSEQ